MSTHLRLSVSISISVQNNGKKLNKENLINLRKSDKEKEKNQERITMENMKRGGTNGLKY